MARSRATDEAQVRDTVCDARPMVGMRLSALRLPFLRMILSENRTPLFGIMSVPEASLFRAWS
jgi:hypothetical protein